MNTQLRSAPWVEIRVTLGMEEPKAQPAKCHKEVEVSPGTMLGTAWGVVSTKQGFFKARREGCAIKPQTGQWNAKSSFPLLIINSHTTKEWKHFCKYGELLGRNKAQSEQRNAKV